ncbi:MAG: hypothetical protein HKO57_10395, partial [Akkermansiaceae bacterium]|nr:hypothetical protein [Akkermansiaceae bacterium]
PRTIDDWFDQLKRIIDQDPYQLEVTYDPVHGFPASAMVDRSVQIADDEEGWSIQNFQAQP